jgi:MFS family permease
MLLFSSRSGALGQKIGPRIPMTAGPLVCAVGLLLLARVGTHAPYATSVLPGVLIFGIGLTLLVAPLTSTALGSLDDAHAGIASGVNNAVARAASLLAVAVLPLAAGIGAGSLTNSGDLHPTYRNAMLICAGLLVLGGVLALIFVPTRLPAHMPSDSPSSAPSSPSSSSRSPSSSSSSSSPSPSPSPSPGSEAPAEPWAPTPDSAATGAGARVAVRQASPIRSFCDPGGPPVHPRG